MRRLVYALIIVALPVYTNCDAFMQYALVVELNLFSVMYLGDTKPFDTRSRNMTEIMNEFINLMISTAFMISMKTFDVKENNMSMVYDIGLMSNYLLISMIGMNFLFVFRGLILSQRLHRLRQKTYDKEKKRIKNLISQFNKQGGGFKAAAEN